MNIFKLLEKLKIEKNLIEIKALNEGWSLDKKFILLDKNNNKFILKISDISLYEYKKQQFELLKLVNKLDINQSKIIEFSTFKDLVYMIFTYLEGVNARNLICNFNEKEQYFFGIDVGKKLKKIHNIKPHILNFKYNYKEKISNKIKKANSCPIKHKYLNIFIDYVLKNIDIISKNYKITITHSDFHIANFLIDNKKYIKIIDFEKVKLENYIDDFKTFIWNTKLSYEFQTGIIDGYFNFKPNNTFFKKLSVLAAESCISNVDWAYNYNDIEVNLQLENCNLVYDYFEGFNNYIPKFYLKDLKYKYKK